MSHQKMSEARTKDFYKENQPVKVAFFNCQEELKRASTCRLSLFCLSESITEEYKKLQK